MMDEQLIFKNRQEFREWLTLNHDTSRGIWLVFGKSKNLVTVKAGEALEEALCFGWIDGLIKSIDENRYIKKFTPRRKGSSWSDKNKGLVTELIQQGIMTKAGLSTVELAKKTGAWNAEKSSPITEEQENILVTALTDHELALANFINMSQSVRRTYTGLYLDAKKEETRISRLDTIVKRLNENKKPM